MQVMSPCLCSMEYHNKRQMMITCLSIILHTSHKGPRQVQVDQTSLRLPVPGHDPNLAAWTALPGSLAAQPLHAGERSSWQ